MRVLARWRVAALAGGAALCVHCFPGPFEELGKLCAPERACSAGYLCIQGHCALPSDAGDNPPEDDGGEPEPPDGGTPPNLLLNGDFEQGTLGWTYSSGTLSAAPGQGLDGSTALTITPTVGGQVAPSVVPVADAGVGAVYCARVWLRGSQGDTVSLVVDEPGQGQTSSGGFTLSAGFAPVLVSRVAQRNGPLTLSLRPALLTLDPFWADNAELWRSETGQCRER